MFLNPGNWIFHRRREVTPVCLYEYWDQFVTVINKLRCLPNLQVSWKKPLLLRVLDKTPWFEASSESSERWQGKKLLPSNLFDADLLKTKERTIRISWGMLRRLWSKHRESQWRWSLKKSEHLLLCSQGLRSLILSLCLINTAQFSSGIENTCLTSLKIVV